MKFCEILLNDTFLPSEIVLKQKVPNIYLLYSFAITTASIYIHGFPLNLSPVVSLFHICFLVSGLSLIYINVKNCQGDVIF